jgi:hypothetical protein
LAGCAAEPPVALFKAAAVRPWPVIAEPFEAVAAHPVGVDVPELPACAGWAPKPWEPAPAWAPHVLPLALWPCAWAPDRPAETLAGWPPAFPAAETGCEPPDNPGTLGVESALADGAAITNRAPATATANSLNLTMSPLTSSSRLTSRVYRVVTH